MSLFEQEETANAEQDLIKYLPEDWAKEMSKYCVNFSLENLINKINKERKNTTIYPEDKDVFKCFKLTSFDNVKVVIIGQDPYFNGNADGLAFSCKNSLSPSLKQIYNAIEMDINKNFSMKALTNEKATKNLEYLAKQGVLLYNPSLTVEKEKPNSHKELWKTFNTIVMKTLSTKNEICFLMWGKTASEALINIPNYFNISNYYLSCEHPAAAARNKSNWKCDHFSLVNEFLKSKNKKEIQWLL